MYVIGVSFLLNVLEVAVALKPRCLATAWARAQVVEQAQWAWAWSELPVLNRGLAPSFYLGAWAKPAPNFGPRARPKLKTGLQLAGSPTVSREVNWIVVLMTVSPNHLS